MIGIMKKDLRHYALNLFILGIGLPAYFSLTYGRMDSAAVYLMVGYLYLVTLAAMLAAELNESRYRGYELLAVLPLRARTIVAGKFLPILLATAAYSALVWAWFSYIETDPGYIAIARRWLLLNASISIIVAGTSYLGAFRFGFDRWVWAHMILMVVSFTMPIVLNESAERGLLTGGTPLGRFITGIDTWAISAVALALYAAIWYAASQVKEGKDA